MKAVIVTILLALFAIPATIAQDISTAITQWNSISTFNPDEGSHVVENTTLVLQGRTAAIWKDAGGVVRKSFAVSEIMGEWNSLSTGESLRMQISNETEIGTITITKSASGNKAVIVITADQPQVYELSLQ